MYRHVYTMKIIKKAVEIGNGAAVYVPKEWSGKQVVVVFSEGIEEIRRRVLNSLIEFMPNIIGVYLYGSYARNEQENDSDIDILVITQEKDERIKYALKDLDVRVVAFKNIPQAIHEYPLFITPIIREAVVFLNPVLLEELKSISRTVGKLRWHLDEAQRTIKIVESFIAIDEKNISPSHIYSLLMRIRICYLIECMTRNIVYTNEGVRRLLMNAGFRKEQVQRWFSWYKTVREGQEIRTHVKKEEIQALIQFLKKYITTIEHEAKKTAKKRH